MSNDHDHENTCTCWDNHRIIMRKVAILWELLETDMKKSTEPSAYKTGLISNLIKDFHDLYLHWCLEYGSLEFPTLDGSIAQRRIQQELADRGVVIFIPTDN